MHLERQSWSIALESGGNRWSPDLDSFFNFLELFYNGFNVGQTGNRTFLILVELSPRANISLETFLSKRMHDLSEERRFEASEYILFSFERL